MIGVVWSIGDYQKDIPVVANQDKFQEWSDISIKNLLNIIDWGSAFQVKEATNQLIATLLKDL